MEKYSRVRGPGGHLSKVTAEQTPGEGDTGLKDDREKALRQEALWGKGQGIGCRRKNKGAREPEGQEGE